MLEKRNDLTYLRTCNFLTLTSHYGKFNQENIYQTLSQLASFHKRYDTNILVCLRFTVLTAVHLQNVNAKFHKVEYRHYSGETQNVYICVQQIYSGQYVPNLITIGQVLWTVYQKHFCALFLVHSVYYIYTVTKKWTTQVMAITLSKPNRSSNLFHRWKEE